MLDRVQNEAMRVTLETTKDTPAETIFPPKQTRQKMEQVKSYFSAVKNPYNPLHEALNNTKGCRLGLIVQELYESRGGRPGLSVLTSFRGFLGRKAILNYAHALVSACSQYVSRHPRTLSITSRRRLGRGKS